jgi:hypothetical protein
MPENRNLRQFARGATLLRSAAVVLLLPLGVPAIATAQPVPIADAARAADTDDGWHLSAQLTMMAVNSVPNMAATPFTREGFATAKAAATVQGDGRTSVNSVTLTAGMQLGCQVDVSDGGSASIGAIAALDPLLFSDNLFDIGPYAGIDGNLTANVRPGSITTLVLGSKALVGGAGQIVVRDAHVNVNGCGGQVAVRFFATATIITDYTNDSINVYGDILTL